LIHLRSVSHTDFSDVEGLKKKCQAPRKELGTYYSQKDAEAPLSLKQKFNKNKIMLSL